MSRVITQIIIHCSDTYVTMDIGAKEIRKWHTDPKPKGRGWLGIGYTNVLRRNGVIEAGRDLDNDGDLDEEIGAHALGHNHNSISLCMVGGRGVDGKPEANFTMHQYASLTRWLLEKKVLYPNAEILGHCDLAGVTKACPSFNVKAFIKGE